VNAFTHAVIDPSAVSPLIETGQAGASCVRGLPCIDISTGVLDALESHPRNVEYRPAPEMDCTNVPPDLRATVPAMSGPGDGWAAFATARCRCIDLGRAPLMRAAGTLMVRTLRCIALPCRARGCKPAHSFSIWSRFGHAEIVRGG